LAIWYFCGSFWPYFPPFDWLNQENLATLQTTRWVNYMKFWLVAGFEVGPPKKGKLILISFAS
jgi:hypothetical protein